MVITVSRMLLESSKQDILDYKFSKMLWKAGQRLILMQLRVKFHMLLQAVNVSLGKNGQNTSIYER